MNLRDLNYLVMVAQTRSFVKAAEKCFVSQPTISTQIKKLENNLGVKLLERSNKRVLLTDVGKAIVVSAQSVLDEVERMKALAENAQDPFAGELKLGAFPSLASYFFPGIVTDIKQALPKTRLMLIEEKTAVLIDLLERGEIDAAFLSLPLKEDFLFTQFLFEDAFKLAVANDHVFAKKDTITAKDLHNQSLLLLDEGHCLRGQALQFCQWNGIQEQPGVRATSLETLRQMVIAGTGITLMPEIAINSEAKEISYISFADPVPKRKIGLAWRKSSVREQLMERLIDLCSGA